MKICIDIQPMISQHAGIGRYTARILEYLSKTKPDNVELKVFFFDFKRTARLNEIKNVNFKPFRLIPGRIVQKLWYFFDQPYFDLLAGPADIFFFPNFIAPKVKKGKIIVTIHDLSFIRYPNFTEEKNLKYLKKKIYSTVTRADCIITDSFFSAREIKELLNVNSQKIHVIYPGIDKHFKKVPSENIQFIKQKYNLNKPYLLSVGTVEPRKNYPFLIEVFENLNFDGYLVIVGAIGWKCESVYKKINNSKIRERIKWLNYIPDEELPAIYSGAELFLFPSLYEGFGFPPLEAMACGTAVVSSDTEPMKEILGQAVKFAKISDHKSWIDSINYLLKDENKRTFIQEGFVRVKLYNWEKTSENLWHIFFLTSES